jgi:hypothetical protein
MTRVLPNPPPPGDDLDVLLGSFFKGEMPAHWPAFVLPEPAQTLPLESQAGAARRQPLRRMFLSRLALAASVGLLLVGGLLLGGKFTPSRGQLLPPLTDPGSANRSKRLPAVPTEPPAKAPNKAKTATTPER